MANYSRAKILKLLNTCANGGTANVRGKALEELVEYIFAKVAGVELSDKNALDYNHSEELDLAFWNHQQQNGWSFLSNIILVECKNWSNPVGSIEVAWFLNKLARRSLDFGIFVSLKGITGDPEDLSSANSIVADALANRVKLIVITEEDIRPLKNTTELTDLVRLKLSRLHLRRTCTG